VRGRLRRDQVRHHGQGPVRVDSGDGIKVDPNKSLEALTKAAHVGVEGKAVFGVCQQLLF
jgi:hypothetical protein